MGKYRKRFNEKARAGMVAKQLALKRSRQKSFNIEHDQQDYQITDSKVVDLDPNAEVLLPMSVEEKEERKHRLEEAIKPPETKISTAKRKRLDKYIDKQLRKQEAVKLMEEISKSKVDLSSLKSLKTLGSRGVTKRQRVEEALELERQGRGTEETRATLYEEREIKDWRQSELFDSVQDKTLDDESNGNEEHCGLETESTPSTFIDKRPQAMGGQGFGLAVSLDSSKKRLPYNWKAILEKARAQKEGRELDSSSEDEFYDEQGVDDHEAEEWTGFNDSTDSIQDIIGEESKGSFESKEIKISDNSDSTEDSDNLDSAEDSDNSDNSEDSDTSDSSEDSNNSENSENDPIDNAPSKGQQFKDWATKTLTETQEKLETPQFNGNYTPLERQEDKEEVPAELAMPSTRPWRKSHFVQVDRNDELEMARLQLPVVREEQRIMEAINNNDCVVICGETGSGKTTQVPQFLFEAGYGSKEGENSGMIGITQPRRVAAVSMANRVASELGQHRGKVAYQIRFDATVKSDTALKFMTDGVLLRELSNDFALKKYSAIIIDEAHERNINTDILIGVLSRVQKLRADLHSQDDSVKPLKLIIMSATLRVSDFTQNTRLFSSPPPVLRVEARQYPVSIHFNRRTHHDYVEEAYKKATKIHQRLPPGGILMFLTGQNEISQICKRLRKRFPFKDKSEQTSANANVRVDARESVTEVEDIEFGIENSSNFLDDDEYQENFDVDDELEEGFEEEPEEGHDMNAPLHVLPLYSLLPTKEQLKVFENPPEGSRLCVIATNVAETSLTIPGIRYVVDCGRSKERHYNEETGVQSFQVSWISKASADQRSGRAGRTGPGHCYRLYSSAVYENDFLQFSIPEILKIPIEALVLQMKSMGIHNILNFPFPTLPSEANLAKGLNLLKYLGALDNSEALTDLGKNMSLFPLSPRFSKILIIGNQKGCLPYITALVAALSVGDPFLGENELDIMKKEDENEEDSNFENINLEDKEKRRSLRQKYFKVRQKFSALDSKADVMKLLSAVCAFDFDAKKEEFSRLNFLRFKSMDEIQKLRQQIAHIVAVNTRPDNVDSIVQTLLSKQKPPSKIQVKAIKQMVTAGFIDNIAIRADLVHKELVVPSKTRIMSFSYIPLFPVKENMDSDGYVYIHPQSILTESGEIPPDYLVYNYISKGSTEMAKHRMRLLTDVTASQLSNIAKNTSLITYSKPLGPPYAPKMLSLTKRECWVIPRIGAAIGSGGVGWDLPVKKVIQEKKSGTWVVI